MSMTRKDFELLAQALRAGHANGEIVAAVSGFCRGQNPKFNEDKFFAAVAGLARADEASPMTRKAKAGYLAQSIDEALKRWGDAQESDSGEAIELLTDARALLREIGARGCGKGA